MIDVTVALAVAAAIAAQGAVPVRSANYSGLPMIRKATAQHELKQVRQDAAVSAARRAVFAARQHGLQRGPCGMPIFQADASIDPKIIVLIPGSRPAQAETQAVAPPCGPFTIAPAHQRVPRPGSR